MFTAILTAHIIGALLTALVALYACVAIVARQEVLYRAVATSLGALAAFEVVTGTLLAVISPSITAVSVCGNIAIYLAVVGLVLSLVYIRIRQVAQRFPVANTLAPVGASIALITLALALGF